MAAYKDLIGQKITKVTSNPSEPKTGQMWYNSTDGALRGLGVVEAFTSAAPLSTARQVLAGAGTQTAGVVFGGTTGSNTAATEEYNGSGFSAGGDLSTARRSISGFGLQTAAVAAGGYVTTVQTATEEYNGSTWGPGGALNTGRSGLAAAGTLTAGLCFGGYDGSSSTTATEEYNGTAWSNNPTGLGTTRQALAGCGTQTAALAFGGGFPSPGISTSTEEYDGSSWTTGGALNTGRQGLGGAGIQTAASAFGGANAPGANQSVHEQYNGTSWSEGPDLATARTSLTGIGTQSANAAVGGYVSAVSSLTEEFTSSTNVITAATFSSGGDTNVAGQARSPASGTQTASTIVGANQGPPNWYSNVTEHYNGSSWTNGGNYPTNAGYLINEGTETASIAAFNGYYPGSGSFLTPQASNEYDGSSWTAGNSYAGSARYGVGAFGTQTAALAACGSIVPADSQVQSDIYDGTNWTSGPNAVNERQRTCGTGILTAGLIGAGYANTPSPSSVNYANASNIEEYDGSSFSNSGAVLFNQAWQQGVFGTATSAIFFGGNNSPSGITAANEFNGTICITAPNMANARTGGGGGGTTTAGLACSGSPPSSLPSGNKTEEFTGEIVTTNVKTLTQS